MDIKLGPKTMSRLVKDETKKLKNGEAPEDDNVHAEMLKAEEQEMLQLMQHVLQDVLDKDVIPDAWKIIKHPKKGNLSKCNNWRGITLLSIISKAFCRIILQRITTAVDKLLRQEQAGFRKGKSCIYHIFVLRQILEQSREWSSSLYVVFVDIENVLHSHTDRH